MLFLALVVSCSKSGSATDTGTIDEKIAKDWLCPEQTEEGLSRVETYYGDEIILDGEAAKARTVIRLPKNSDSMVRTHCVVLDEDSVEFGDIKLTYASPRYAIFNSNFPLIASAVNERKDTINSSISLFEADVQTEWRKTIELSKNEKDQCIYIAFLPLYVAQYSDETKMSFLSFILVPVKYEVCTYSVNGDGTYTYDSEFAEQTKNLEVKFTADARGNISLA